MRRTGFVNENYSKKSRNISQNQSKVWDMWLSNIFNYPAELNLHMQSQTLPLFTNEIVRGVMLSAATSLTLEQHKHPKKND